MTLEQKLVSVVLATKVIGPLDFLAILPQRAPHKMQYSLVSTSLSRTSTRSYRPSAPSSSRNSHNSLILTHLSTTPSIRSTFKQTNISSIALSFQTRSFSTGKKDNNNNPSNTKTNKPTLESLKKLFDQRDEPDDSTVSPSSPKRSLEAEIQSVQKLFERSIVEDVEKAGDQDVLPSEPVSNDLDELYKSFTFETYV